MNLTIEELKQKVIEFWKDPKTGFVGARKLTPKLKDVLPNDKRVTYRFVAKVLSSISTSQIVKPLRHRQSSQPTVDVEFPKQRLQADLLDVSSLKTSNGGVRYLLVAQDQFSKKSFAIPILGKKGPQVLKAIQVLFEQAGVPKEFSTDPGKEFTTRDLRTYLKKSGTRQIIAATNMHSQGQVESFNKTLRNLTLKYLTEFKTSKYIDVLQDLLDSYNNSVQKTTRRTPNSVHETLPDSELVKFVRDRILTEAKKKIKKETLKPLVVGDQVRVVSSDIRLQFRKSTNLNYSSTVFKIVRISSVKRKGGLPPIFKYEIDLPRKDVDRRQIAPKRIFLRHELVLVPSL